MRRGLRYGVASFATLVTLALVAPAANAVVVQLSSGRVAGVYLRAGLSATTYEQKTGARAVTARRPAVVPATNDGLVYGGGPVLHTTDPYLVFWDPSSAISATSRHVMTQYFTDAAQDSSNPSDVYAYRILSQYTDSGGSSAQGQTFSAGAQVINDAQAYPSVDTGTCTSSEQSGYAHCITDNQIHTEVTRLINADHLPTGTGTNAPIYFVVTPENVNVCINGGQGCSSDTFCAYHSSYPGPSSSTVIYASIPFTLGADCQDAGPVYPPTQEPNGDVADVITDNMSHENAESVTDPLGNAWLTTNGEEVADQCEAYGPNDPNDPSGDPTSMDAYMPELGGSQPDGTLYDQLINGDPYFTQTLWSNSTNNCEATAMISPAFTAPASIAAEASARFDPTASSSTDGYSSTTWNWGDGSANTVTAGAPAATNHTFSTAGTYTVTLRLVDAGGRSAQVSHTVTVGSPPTVAFSESPTVAETGAPIAFSGSASDPNQGQSITGYSWNFGDGSPAGTGAALSHAYAAPGTYPVTLTTTGSEGFTASVVHTVTVVAVPVALPALSTAPPVAGSPVSFNGGFSTGGISAWAWNFGDGATGSGATPQHTYAKPGTYTVTLTVTDPAGFTASQSLPVTVVAPGKITGVSVKRIRGRYYLLVTVSRAGTVRFGSEKVVLKRAGKARFKLSLSGAEQQRIAGHRTVPQKVTIRYTPVLGPPVRLLTTVKVKP